MKKMLVVLLVALVAVFSVNAIGPEFGIKAGLTMGNIVYGDDNAPQDFDTDMFRAGLTGGIMMEMPMGPLSLGAELLYTQKGEKFDTFANNYLAAVPVSVTAKLDYIEVPVMAKLSLLPLVKFYGGVSFGFLVSAEMVSEINDTEVASADMKDFMNSTEMGAIFGAQVKISKLVFDARYNMGLTDIMKDNEGDAVKLSTLYATVGFMF